MASAIYDNLPFNEDAVLNLADKIGINKEQLKKMLMAKRLKN